LNLTRGGQGDPAKRWKSLLAASRIKLKKVWPAFEAYFQENGHLRIPQKEIVNGVNLGTVVSNIRSHKCFLQYKDFKEWLEEHGFVYDETRAHLEEEVWPALKTYFQENGHLRIPTKEIVNGVNLGKVVNQIRSQKIFLHHNDFKKWLEEHGFVYDGNRAHLEVEVWPAFEAYFEENGHLRIHYKEIVNGVNLGNVVHTIRSRKDFLQYTDFKEWLEEHGFVYDEYRARLEEKVWPAFKTYFQENGHLRIPQKKIVNGVKLGWVVNGIRSQKSFLNYKDFAMWLWYGCFEMHTKDVDENRKRWESVF
jgi:virulence-associated protein VapD